MRAQQTEKKSSDITALLAYIFLDDTNSASNSNSKYTDEIFKASKSSHSDRFKRLQHELMITPYQDKSFNTETQNKKRRKI